MDGYQLAVVRAFLGSFTSHQAGGPGGSSPGSGGDGTGPKGCGIGISRSNVSAEGPAAGISGRWPQEGPAFPSRQPAVSGEGGVNTQGPGSSSCSSNQGAWHTEAIDLRLCRGELLEAGAAAGHRNGSVQEELGEGLLGASDEVAGRSSSAWAELSMIQPPISAQQHAASSQLAGPAMAALFESASGSVVQGLVGIASGQGSGQGQEGIRQGGRPAFLWSAL